MKDNRIGIPISIKGKEAQVMVSVKAVGYDGQIVGQATRKLHVSTLPKEYALQQNYPNPFNPITNIRYDLPNDSRVTLVIYNILGRQVRTLVNDRKVAGYHSALWDGKDIGGSPVATGVYIYRLDARGVDGHSYSKVRKMLLLK